VFDGLGLGAVGEQHGHILLNSALFEQVGKGLCSAALLAHHNATGVQVVVQGFAFAQKFGAKKQVGRAQSLGRFGGVAHGHNAFDHHHRLGVDGHHVFNHCLNALCFEEVGDGVVVGRGGNDDVVGTLLHPIILTLLYEMLHAYQKIL
jgi:hypothetical protein